MHNYTVMVLLSLVRLDLHHLDCVLIGMHWKLCALFQLFAVVVICCVSRAGRFPPVPVSQVASHLVGVVHQYCSHEQNTCADVLIIKFLAVLTS